ncbi:MAG: hypothetical protein ACE5LF_00930 [Alphaproteobacteria bacterium]
MPILIADDYKATIEGGKRPAGDDRKPLNGLQLPEEGNKREHIGAPLASFD